MADKKRKGTENKTPAKKRKVETPKSSNKKHASAKKAKAPTPKKVTSSKVKKPEPKKTPSKTAKTPAKAVKTPQKGNKAAKTPQKKATPKPAQKKDVKKSKLAATSVTRAKLDKAKVNSMKAKLDKAKLNKAKALKAKAAAAKAKAAAAKSKLKTTKSAAKPKQVQKTVSKPKAEIKAKATNEKKGKTPVKKPEPKPTKAKEVKKPDEIKKDTPKPKAPEKKPVATASATKRKITDKQESTEAPRKRRMITPNKKFADFELDVPTKRTITPNKKYADFETDTSQKRVSELRAFIQDKKKTPTSAETPDSPEKSGKSKTATPSTSTKKTVMETKETPARDIKVFKPSEMKPAEKLMKKLQKKLEKEAKSSSVSKPSENREKAKIKITKVVTYNKPMSSDEKEMRTLKTTPKAAAKPKATVATAKTPKQPVAKQNVTKSVKATPKATPKQAKAPEKQPPKPKKIKELRREERPIQAKFASQKNIKLPDDNEKISCWITGISVFPSGEIIMVDMANRKIKLFSNDFEYLSQVKLDTIPQDISISPVNASDAYFTKPFSKEGIQKISMSDGKLTLKESFWTNGTNRGITCTKAGILTSVQDGRYHDLDINHFKIDLLDYEGKVLQSVSTDSNGSRLFKLPLYFTVNSTGKQMIVADCIKHFSYVVSVDMTGKVKFKYEGINHNLVTPRGLTIDDEDNIYVTEWERHNVYILSPAGKRLQVLFTHQELVEEGLDGLQKPYQLCFYKQEDTKKLIVSQEGCNTIKVFQMMKKGPETEAAKQAETNAVAEKKGLLNGEASPTKGKPATPKKNGSQPKANITKAVTEEKKPAKVEKVDEKAPKEEEQVVEKKEEPVSVKEPEPEKAAALDKAKVEESREESQATEVTEPTETEEEPSIEQSESKMEEEEADESPPTLDPEFGDDFETAENEMEGSPAIQDAINSLNDSKEIQTVNENDTLETAVDTNQVQVEVYEQISVPQVETETVNMQAEEIIENVDTQPEEMEVQHIELVNSQYEQEVGLPLVEEIITQSVETEIQSVPIETVAHETIIIQQDINQMSPDQYEKIETVSMNNNDASDLVQTETVHFVTDMNLGENYATNIAQGEIITEMPEEIVTMVTETV